MKKKREKKQQALVNKIIAACKEHQPKENSIEYTGRIMAFIEEHQRTHASDHIPVVNAIKTELGCTKKQAEQIFLYGWEMFTVHFESALDGE